MGKRARNSIIAVAGFMLFLVAYILKAPELPRWFWPIVALCLAAAFLIRVWFAIVGRLTGPPPKVDWSGLSLGLFLFGAWSNNVARDYAGALGTEVVAFLGPAFMGMAFTALLLIRGAPQHAGSAPEEQRS